MKRWLGWLVAGLIWCTQGMAATAPPRGALVIIGGALRADNAVVWRRIVELSGGAAARIAVLPTAAGNPERSGRNIASQLNRQGAAAFVVPLAPAYKQRDYRLDAEDEQLAQSIRQAGGVYFAGGDQTRITRALVRPDGSRTAVLQAIWDMYERGGVIAGTSAGAAIMSSTMYDETRSVIDTLSSGVRDGAELAPGLGFIGKEIFVDQHLLARGRFARMLPAMLAKGYKLGLGIDENTALVIRRQREVEVLGYQGALLVDLQEATVDSATPQFNLSNARISYYDRGDQFELPSGRYTPSADKIDGKVDPAHPANREPVYSSDILGHNAVLIMMERLIDNVHTQAVGIATAAPGEPHPEQGYEFKFTRVAESVGYESASSEAYTVLRLRLDVRPLQISQPWYR